ncbi:MAG: glycosyltransferase family 2 protein, partial [Chloroflexi bacterium]|nr:glycosyltransferase family 2 protein [Chloroflexota bacterium]
VSVVIPAYNEEAQLEKSISTLVAFLQTSLQNPWQVTIADNASRDGTPEVGQRLAKTPGVDYLRLERKGRGYALRQAWSRSQADILCYMDVDLSTNLSAFPPMVEALHSGNYQVGIGSRLMRGAQVTRQWKREILSRGYNLLIRLMFLNKFSDAQCGFKALTRQAAQELLPLVQDNDWFFDTELLLRAEQRGYRIFEIPVEWIEDLDTRVDLLPTIIQDVKGLVRVRFS